MISAPRWPHTEELRERCYARRARTGRRAAGAAGLVEHGEGEVVDAVLPLSPSGVPRCASTRGSGSTNPYCSSAQLTTPSGSRGSRAGRGCRAPGGGRSRAPDPRVVVAAPADERRLVCGMVAGPRTPPVAHGATRSAFSNRMELSPLSTMRTSRQGAGEQGLVEPRIRPLPSPEESEQRLATCKPWTATVVASRVPDRDGRGPPPSHG